MTTEKKTIGASLKEVGAAVKTTASNEWQARSADKKAAKRKQEKNAEKPAVAQTRKESNRHMWTGRLFIARGAVYVIGTTLLMVIAPTGFLPVNRIGWIPAVGILLATLVFEIVYRIRVKKLIQKYDTKNKPNVKSTDLTWSYSIVTAVSLFILYVIGMWTMFDPAPVAAFVIGDNRYGMEGLDGFWPMIVIATISLTGLITYFSLAKRAVRLPVSTRSTSLFTRIFGTIRSFVGWLFRILATSFAAWFFYGLSITGM